MKKKIVAVALSGGVDSATSAYILKMQGYEVFGITMKLFENQSCEDAQKVANALEIKHYIVDFSEYFEKEVINKFIDMYLQGFTPNPCILCNIKVKYGLLLDEALKLGADYMALGHYAKIEFCERKNTYKLLKSDIVEKDQSYYLYHLNQERLKHILLPLNNKSSLVNETNFKNKNEVREYISNIVPFVAKKKDSTDICFTNGKSLFNYIKSKRNIINCKGNFIDTKGIFIGKHKGIFNYTIGQKRGLDLNTEKTYYVLKIKADTNEIVLTENEQDLYIEKIYVNDINYVDKENHGKEKISARVKLCQWGYFIPCEIINQSDNSAIVKFNKPERASAIGQSAVFYINDEVLGGGMIVSNPLSNY